MNGTAIFASLLVTGKSLMCTRSDDSLTSMPFCCSGFDLRETVDAQVDSFTNEAFRTLQGMRASYSSSVTAEDVFGWLSQQPYRTSLCSLDDVAAAMEPFSDAYGVMHYEGFLHLVLLRQPNDEWLEWASLWRHCPSIFSTDVGSGLSVEVACRLTHILDHENQRI